MMQLLMKRITKKLFVQFQSFLSKPATNKEIAEVEKVTGVSFSDDLKELYRLHNGELQKEPGLFFGLTFLPLTNVLTEWQSCSELAENGGTAEVSSTIVPEEWIKEQTFNPAWIPFAADFAGNFLAVDMDPGIKGTQGQVIYFGQEENFKCVVARNVGDLLEFISRTLLEGHYTIDGVREWSYGNVGNQRFSYELRKMALPILHPEPAGNEETENTNPAESPQLFPREQTLYVDGQVISSPFLPAAGPDERERILSTDVKLDGIKSLKVSVFSYEQWTALTNASELEHLHIHLLSGIAFPDLTRFLDLKSLQSLTIEHCRFRDLKFLTRNKRLAKLTFIDCEITDASDIKEMPIEILELDQTSFDNLEVIAECPSLKTFSGSFRQFQILKPLVSNQVEFSRIIGRMTDAQKGIWLSGQ